MVGAQRRTDTRREIQRVALELFAEQGYEKTSLREIAERLGVTKAALYYHFKTKEEIVTSLFGDFREQIDEIIEWGRGHEMNDENRAEVLRRYAELLDGPGDELIHFVQGNQSTMHKLRESLQMFERLTALAGLLSTPDASVVEKMRTVVAIFTLHIARAAPFPLSGTPEERRAAALEIAAELISGQRPNLSSTSSGESPKSASE